MHQAQLGLGLGGAIEEGDFHPFLIPAVFLDAVAHLLGDGLHLAESGARDPARELGETLIHQNGDHADLDALIEILAAAGKAQSQTVVQMDVSHDGSPQIALSGHLFLQSTKKLARPEGGMDAHPALPLPAAEPAGKPLISSLQA